MLPFILLKGDLVYFELFQDSHHKSADLGFLIPIPGYSEPADAIFDSEGLKRLQSQVANLRAHRNPQALAQ